MQEKVRKARAAAARRAVERAIADLRRGEPVAIADGQGALLALGIENAQQAALDHMADAGGGAPYILLSPDRAQSLRAPHKGLAAVPIDWPGWLDLGAVTAIADPVKDLRVPLKGPFKRKDLMARPAHAAAVQLAKLAQLLPAAIAADAAPADPAAWARENDLLLTAAADVLAHEARLPAALAPVADARVPLKGAENSRVYAFRPADGGIEHLAILVGDPPRNKPVLTRIHSECLTGDVLGSLKCDCGDQLRGALDMISKAGGGALLYLAQEGRGIGLMNKLRAYALQDQGYDTVDANLKLGFAADERLFGPAAAILKALGFSAVRLMTNNPDKVAALADAGVIVTERVPHQFPSNSHNAGYLATKRDRSGHLLG